MKIIITSKNPVKRNATEIAFQLMFPEIKLDIQEISVLSDVNKQPMSEGETLKGAQNRVKNVAKLISAADFYVGIEGGVEIKNGQMESFAWVYIQGKNGQTGTGRTGTFFLPEKLSDLIKSGIELGKADDIVFKQTNTKQKMGTIGILTKNIIDRTEYYRHAIIFALIPFVNPELY